MMNKIIRTMAILAVCALALGLPGLGYAADANPPERMTYQGYLVDSDGDALGVDVPVNYDVVFRIYSVKQGGLALWAEQQTVTVDKGYFSVLLGQGTKHGSEPTGKLSAAFTGVDISDRFIGITVKGLGGTDVEVAPRLALVTSPFAYTATQALRLTDGNGNKNFFKEGGSLKLGAGSNPTLTLPESGGATLSGALTAHLDGLGWGVQIDNGALSTTFGANNDSFFAFNTQSPGFHFNKAIHVSGDILSHNRDAVLGPSDNADTYLRVRSATDEIVAQADEFRVQGDSSHLLTKFTASAVELRTDAASFYMNKPLSVDGVLIPSHMELGTDGWVRRTAHNSGALMGAYNHLPGAAKASNPIYILGSNYKPGLEVLNNMYGVGYTDWTASFITGAASGWGFYVASGGKARTWLSGNPGAVSYIAKDGGKVGIGTDTPEQVLDVNGMVSIRGHYLGTLDDYSSYMGSLQLHVGVGGDYWIIGPQRDDGDGDLMYTYYNGQSYDSIAYLDPQNDVWYEDSDRSLKKNIEPMASVLDQLNQLEAVRFNLSKHEEGAAKKIGFIAQDVQEVFPDLVYDTEGGRMGLNYHDFGVLSVKATQELDLKFKDENEQLKARVGELESEVALLKASLSRLEELVGKMGPGL